MRDVLKQLCAAALVVGLVPTGDAQAFEANLGRFNGVSARSYEFNVLKLKSTSGSYASLMVAACEAVGMKPVCDHPSYCKTDQKALYIGQSGHLAYKPHRNSNNYVPAGFSGIRNYWTGLCSYTAKANGNYALCNIPANSHGWKDPKTANPGLVCGKVSCPSLLRTRRMHTGARRRHRRGYSAGGGASDP
jgi:hypothetical protein